MNRPVWLLPLVGLAAGLSIAGLAFLPFGRRPANYVPIEPPPPPPTPPQSQLAQKEQDLSNAPPLTIPADVLARVRAGDNTSDPNQPTTTTGTAGDITSQDEKLYDIQIRSNLRLAEINNARFNEMSSEREQAAGLSSAERAKSPVIAEGLRLTKEAQHFVDLAGCLNDQRKRGVGYYQGKSTCTAMFPDL